MDIPAVETLALHAPPVFDNSSVWYNFTTWTAQHLGYAVNMSRLAPSIEDLVWAGPRMVMKLGRLGSFISFPDAIDGFGQRVIPESTESAVFYATTTAFSATRAAEPTPSALPSVGVDDDPNALVTRLSLEGVKGLGNVFSYATSKWALCCVAMAVILNRTLIFAATRRRLRLRWSVRLFLRATPIALFVLQGRALLRSIQCQTSPEFAQLRWGDASKSSDLAFAHVNPFLHGLSTALLFGSADAESCRAIRMVPLDIENPSYELRGSLSRLWPLFGTFCLSHFIETISCAVQGRPISAETGMTLFEHSLAFAEADSTIGGQLGWNRFANSTSAAAGQSNAGTTIALTRSMVMKRVNTSPEVLLVSFLSAMNHVTSHILGVFNLQPRFRLINTGFWGLAFMASIVWSLVTFSLDETSTPSLLRYPAVSIVGFIPHVLVLAGILVCALIYCLALVLSALATPDIPGEGRRAGFMERLAIAHGNMQANVSLSEIRIRMDMDFYTALLRAGFGAITMASEAVYLNEDSRVNLKRFTWLEDERFQEMEETRLEWLGTGSYGSPFGSTQSIGLVPGGDGSSDNGSGYSRERVAQKASKAGGPNGRIIRDGVGAAERSGRWILALDYVMHINKLLLAAWAIAICKMLTRLGIQTRPRWLRWLSQRPKTHPAHGRPTRVAPEYTTEWMIGSDVSSAIPRTDRVDVEAEVRRWAGRRNASASAVSGAAPMGEEDIDDTLYGWWLKGGWWGSSDSSGDYQPPVHKGADGSDDGSDFDATSVISAADTEDQLFSAWESDPDELDDGQRTPTQRSPNPFASINSRPPPTVDNPLAMSDLARLLDPSSPEERDQARALAAHLGSDKIMTRSAFHNRQQLQRAQVLTTNRQAFEFRPGASSRGTASGVEMTPEEEAIVLEQLLLSRRKAAAAAAAASGDRSGDEEGGHTNGPQCVVCQCASRSIILWPCRCLSLCDDCRVSLAMNNFDKCVCCRREVISFSRIYVP